MTLLLEALQAISQVWDVPGVQRINTQLPAPPNR
jgi:hypothetical protein